VRLLEYEGMLLFSQYGIPVPKQILLEDLSDLRDPPFTFPVVLKAQVPVGGRGKAGGVQLAKDGNELREKAKLMLGSELKGVKVKKMLIAQAPQVDKEYYTSFTIDRQEGILFLASFGGVEIEEQAREHPELLYRRQVDAFRGFSPYEARWAGHFLNLEGDDLLSFSSIAFQLYKLLREKDFQLAEINPLAKTSEGLMALDAKLIFDDNSAYRHPEITSAEEIPPLEKEARQVGISYVELDGEVAVIGCGAGLVMASLDLINYLGARPACFLDLGGGATTDMVKKGLEIVSKNPRVKAVFINIFGGITRCDEIASGIVQFSPKLPISVRLTGTNEEEGMKILNSNGYHAFSSMEEAALEAVKLAQKGAL